MDLNEFKTLAVFETGSKLTKLVLSSNGNVLYSGHDNGLLRVWDPNLQFMLTELQISKKTIYDIIESDSAIYIGGGDNKIIKIQNSQSILKTKQIEQMEKIIT